jgi:hypothetical protein
MACEAGALTEQDILQVVDHLLCLLQVAGIVMSICEFKKRNKMYIYHKALACSDLCFP